ncbi:MAG: glycosyltransferase [Nitrospirae bacterium]|nr:glycosyltransferase [Nitrospirota bacterium]
MPVKILILDNAILWGGGTNSMLELLKRIDKGKYHITALFYNNYKNGSSSDIKTEIEKLKIDAIFFKKTKITAYLKLLHKTGKAALFFNKKLKARFNFFMNYNFCIKPDAQRIADKLKKINIKLLYLNNYPSANLEGILAAEIAGIPVIQHSRIKSDINAFEAGVVNNIVSRIICVSSGVMEDVINQGISRDKCVVVHNGIASDFHPSRSKNDLKKELMIKNNTIIIGTVCSLIKRKRVSDLLYALNEIDKTSKTIVDYKCILVGDGAERKNLEKLVHKLNLKDRVIFTGFNPDAISYTNIMDIFVLTSEREGLPRAILEAMLMAKPVVAYDVIGPSELVLNEQTGYLVPFKNIKILSNTIQRLLVSKPLRDQLGENGKRRVIEQFSIENYVAGVGKVIKEVLGY